ncbi:MAG: sulfur carrier protein ThiS [Akkermansiaceae bacterium]
MTLTINGHPRDFASAPTLPELLESLGLKDKPVVIEHNQEALSPSEFQGRPLQNGDSLEIITIAAGG